MQHQEHYRKQNNKENNRIGEQQSVSSGGEIVDNSTKQRFHDQNQISMEEELHPYSRY